MHNRTSTINDPLRPKMVIHCTGGTGRTAFMVLSYIWLRRALMHNSFHPKNLLEKVNLFNDTDNIYKKKEICREILNDNIIIYLRKQILLYDLHAEDEIFKEPEQEFMLVSSISKTNLFMNRITNFIKAFMEYEKKIFDNSDNYTYILVLKFNENYDENSIIYKYRDYIRLLTANKKIKYPNYNNYNSPLSELSFSYIAPPAVDYVDSKGTDPFYNKYLKYKNKYLQLKKLSNK